MDTSELKEILSRGEDSKTQFKTRFTHVDGLASEICAMANTDGGIIVVGVSDKGEIVGVDNLTRLNQWVSSAASQKIDPPVSVVTENIRINEKLVVIIKIPRGTNKPYAANKTEFWVKVGADKRRATREELRRLMQAAHSMYADELPVPNASLTDLNISYFKDFYEKEYGLKLEEDPLQLERVLKNLKLINNSNLTLAGPLLFGDRPERIRPQFIVKAVAFIGNEVSVSEYLDSENLEGTLYEQYRNTMAFLKRNLRKVQRGRNFNLPGKMEIPGIALEEAVVNALVHRDYFINSSIRVFIFDHQVEIISPGKLPNAVTVEIIKQGIQVARNPILLSFAGRLDLPYRGIGSGIRRIIAECKKEGIPEPEFVEDKATEEFKVIFSREVCLGPKNLN
jgi:predicted HTH transcriptional regulator